MNTCKHYKTFNVLIVVNHIYKVLFSILAFWLNNKDLSKILMFYMGQNKLIG